MKRIRSEEWRIKDKVLAKEQIRRAINRGDISKPKICIKCNKITNLEGHHPNYSKPLEVEWLCSSCHRQKHGLLELPKIFL